MSNKFNIPPLPSRAAQIAERERIRAVREAALDPAMVGYATAVCWALSDYYVHVTQGTSWGATTVTVWEVKADQKPKVDGIAMKATQGTDFFSDCRHDKSYITVTLKAGRAAELKERHIERFGDGGHMIWQSADGSLTNDATAEAASTHPLVSGGYE